MNKPTIPQPEQQQQDGGDFQTGHIGWSPDYKSQDEVPLKKFACDVTLSSELLRMADAQRKPPQPVMIPLADVLPLLEAINTLETCKGRFHVQKGYENLMAVKADFLAKHPIPSLGNNRQG